MIQPLFYIFCLFIFHKLISFKAHYFLSVFFKIIIIFLLILKFIIDIINSIIIIFC